MVRGGLGTSSYQINFRAQTPCTPRNTRESEANHYVAIFLSVKPLKRNLRQTIFVKENFHFLPFLTAVITHLIKIFNFNFQS